MVTTSWESIQNLCFFRDQKGSKRIVRKLRERKFRNLKWATLGRQFFHRGRLKISAVFPLRSLPSELPFQ